MHKTVLIVDDSEITRHALQSFFLDCNLNVITCNDGLEGVQKALEYKPIIIFLDLMMPNLNGVKMLQVIKVMDDLKHIPVVVISGNTNKRNVLAAIEAGAERVISKPLKKEIIIQVVNEILGKDFLVKNRGETKFTYKENDELTKQLRNFFLNSFPEKERGILESFKTKNIELLKMITHEIKGTGGAIGYPEITILAGEIYGRLMEPKTNWEIIELKYDDIFAIIKKMKNS
ncbi:MAG: response regulator [Bacteroidetes bacterium]|nr:response regulator [Bacteroidota bacterium]MBU1115132.1 response regulator [Bacteroidota bacterium]MBU1799271.1 response regulator [Bacteroidota bacterium]